MYYSSLPPSTFFRLGWGMKIETEYPLCAIMLQTLWQPAMFVMK